MNKIILSNLFFCVLYHRLLTHEMEIVLKLFLLNYVYKLLILYKTKLGAGNMYLKIKQ